MSDSVDTQIVELSCPACGHETAKTIGWLKAHHMFVCHECGNPVLVNADELAQRIRWAEHPARGS